MSKIKIFTLIVLPLFTICSCSFWNRSLQEVLNDPFAKEEVSTANRRVHMAPLQMPRNIVVCRNKQCAPVKLSMSKEYIYNSLVQMLQNNTNQKALICAADSSSHNCYAHYISAPITVGITPAYVYVDSVRISDVQIAKGSRSVNLLLNYNISYNGQTPDCTPSRTMFLVKNSENIVMEDSGFQCKMTTIGTTTIKNLFLVDYIDLDYGFIGGFYSLGLSGPAYGGGSGYMLLRLPDTSFTPKAILPLPQEEKPQSNSLKEKIKEYLNGPKDQATPSTNNVKVFPINNK